MPRDGVAKPREQLDPREQRREPASWNAELDPRETKFVELYLETSNATRSALAAGYGRNYQNAGVYANRLLKKRMTRPVRKSEVRMARSVCINVSGLGVTPAKMEIRAIQAS